MKGIKVNISIECDPGGEEVAAQVKALIENSCLCSSLDSQQNYSLTATHPSSSVMKITLEKRIAGVLAAV